MPVKTHLWKVGDRPSPLGESTLSSEQMLEDMIVRQPRILSSEWMLIGRQEHTNHGGRIDLLALAPDGSLVLIELKRDRTPREVVAQSLDYAAWVEQLQSEDIAQIYRRYNEGRNLADDSAERFGHQLDEEELNQSHQMIIVASELDDSTERIVDYLNDRGVAINVLYFQVFSSGDDQILSRTWLLDPVHSQTAASKSASRISEPWNGEFYCSFGLFDVRSWPEAVRYGFISGGGGLWYSRTLQLLAPGDRVWVKVPGRGFVGVGVVEGEVQSAAEFKVQTESGERPVLDVVTGGHYHREFVDDEEQCEYFVPIRWLETVSLQNAVNEVGMFGNQNTICKPTTPKWRSTVERLKSHFPKFDTANIP